jgi:hypothetical protein
MRASVRNSSLHNNGDKPSDGSSSNRIVGADISASDRHHLPLAAGHGAHDLLGALLESWEQTQDARQILRLALPRTQGIGAEDEIFLHGQIGEDTAVLGHERNAGLDDLVRRACRDVGAVHNHRAAVHLAGLTGDRAQKRALAGAVRAKHDHDFAFRYRGRYVFQRTMAAVKHRDVAGLKHSRLRDRPG